MKDQYPVSLANALGRDLASYARCNCVQGAKTDHAILAAFRVDQRRGFSQVSRAVTQNGRDIHDEISRLKRVYRRMVFA